MLILIFILRELSEENGRNNKVSRNEIKRKKSVHMFVSMWVIIEVCNIWIIFNDAYYV